MSPQNTARDWARLIYHLSQNTLSLIGVVLTTSSAITLIGFWMYDFMLPGPPHPYVGILLFLILPGVFVLGLLLIPVGIVLRRRPLRLAGELPDSLSGHRFENIDGAQQPPPYRICHHLERLDFRVCILQGRVVHGLQRASAACRATR